MSILVLEWAELPILELEWAGDDGVTFYDPPPDPVTQIAAIVGPPGRDGDLNNGTAIDGGNF